jgi:hypothetical protein
VREHRPALRTVPNGAAHGPEIAMPQTYTVGSRSWLVSAIAWAFIACGLLACGLTLLQYAVLGSMLPPWAGTLPAASALLLQHLHWVLALAGALSLLLLISGVGLLLRLEWARRAAIGVLLATALANLAGLWLQHEVVHVLVTHVAELASLPAAARGLFDGFAYAAQGLALLLTLAGCVVLAWLARCLGAPMVRQEFA